LGRCLFHCDAWKPEKTQKGGFNWQQLAAIGSGWQWIGSKFRRVALAAAAAVHHLMPCGDSIAILEPSWCRWRLEQGKKKAARAGPD